MLPRLDNQSPLPLHAQLEQAIRILIESDQWAAGEPIPSERTLMQMAAVSRATVRQAISALVQAGLLRREHGRGTFVAPSRLEQPMHTVYSFAQQIAQLGRTLEDRVVQRKLLAATPEIAAPLGLAAGERVIHIQRVRLLEGVPFTLDNFYIANALCPDLMHAEIVGSLYRLLAEQYDLPVIRSVDTLEPVAADRATALYLQVAPGAPLMVVERVAYTRGDLPLHLARNYVRGDMCRFRIQLSSEPAALELMPRQ